MKQLLLFRLQATSHVL